jgi:aminoglycoside phosphotransferase family enzyme/predicted kinase
MTAVDGGPPAVAETHSAWVTFLGDRAYKVKKPVRFDFLDFSTPELRGRALRRELELNRRLAPDVYLGVYDVVDADGNPCECVLVMRRMPAERRLSALVTGGGVTDDDVRAVARVVAAFHAGSATSPAIATAGAPDVVREKVVADLDEMEAFVPELLDGTRLREARDLVRRYLDGRAPLFRDRIARGCVRDGHGDLLADDIFCLPDGPRILDCIEFDDRLRHGDVLADVAFLAMDLERLGAAALAGRLFEWYAEFSNEHHPASLGHFYVATRALVRTKVACVRARQGDVAARRDAWGLLDLALRHLRAAQVRLVLVGGPPGTGKSTVASALAERFGWVVLRSDEVRKDITGVGRAASPAAVGAGIYTAFTTSDTYAALLSRAAAALGAGESVVLDATWSDASWRTAARRCGLEASAAVVELCCTLPPEVADARIAERARVGHDVSDADPEVAAALRAGFAPWPAAVEISTLPPVEAVVDVAAEAALGRGAAP